jgi:hypothetical protein
MKSKINTTGESENQSLRTATSGKAETEAGFIGFRRKPLILPILAGFCRFLPVFANKKKIL